MSLEVVLVPKISKLTWDMKRSNLPQEEIIKRYKQDGVNAEVIIGSHNRQMEILQKASQILQIPTVNRDEFTLEIARQFDVIIALGGDNHFLYVARFLDRQILVGINSDPLSSLGMLLRFKEDNLEKIQESIFKEEFNFENWTRLQATVNDQKLPFLALSEIFVGESHSLNTSRHILRYRGQEEEQKSSGLLIMTGAGLTGWAKAATRFWPKELVQQFPSFAPNEVYARFILREGFKGDICIGDLEKNENLTITSLNDDTGIIAFDSDPCDSRFCFSFPRGYQAKISISNQPLRVAVK